MSMRLPHSLRHGFPLARRFAVLLLTLPAAGGAAARELPLPLLVQDFAPEADASSIDPDNLTALGGALYFSGTDADHGAEPWISDGSGAGTRRLADLCPGVCSSAPAGFFELNGATVFHIFDGDGSAIVRLADGGGAIEQVARFDSSIVRWQPLGSLIYFATRDNRLWRSDGTADGTVVAGVFHPVPIYAEPPLLAAIGGAIYYVDAGSLHRVDPGAAPRAVSSLGAPGTIAHSFTPLDAGRFLFVGCAPSYGLCQAYVSDGTGDGTRPLLPIAGGSEPPNPIYSEPPRFLVFRGRAYFLTDGEVSYQPVAASTDGTAGGTRREPAFPAGSAPFTATASHLFYFSGGALFALAADGAHMKLGAEGTVFFGLLGRSGERIVFTYSDPGGIARPGFSRIALSDGTPAGTADLFEGGGEAGATLGGLLYFAGNVGLPGTFGNFGLWRSDGTVAGTAEVPTPKLTPRSSDPQPYRVGDSLAVEATDEVFYEDRHVYQVDPFTLAQRRLGAGRLAVKAAGPKFLLLADSPYVDARLSGWDGSQLHPLPIAGFSGGNFAADGSFFYFTDAPPGQMLWESDGSAGGSRLLYDFTPHFAVCGEFCGHDGILAPSGGQIFFYAEEDGGANQRLSVWDRARGEKRTLLEGLDLYPLMLPFSGGRLVFDQGGFGPGPRRLWTSDGTVEGTRPFFDLGSWVNLRRLFEMGGHLYFGADHGDGGGETLFRSDLTTAGTTEAGPIGKVGFGAAAVAGNEYFFATDAGAGRELGVTDGTPAGTIFLDLRPGPLGSNPDHFFALADGRAVFAASGDEAGYELWISDGSAAGTYRLTDLHPGAGASSPAFFAQAGGRLFFQASDGEHGRELWALDLPPRDPPPPSRGRRPRRR